MKSNLQNIDPIPSTWTNVLDYYINGNNQLLVSNILQDGIFHYVTDTFLTDTVITALGGKNV